LGFFHPSFFFGLYRRSRCRLGFVGWFGTIFHGSFSSSRSHVLGFHLQIFFLSCGGGIRRRLLGCGDLFGSSFVVTNMVLCLLDLF
jgi:hypothetical protein